MVNLMFMINYERYFFRWGGCIVALCDSLHESTTYINELKEKYYKTIPEFQEEDAGNIVFVTSPQRGAEIYLTN